MNEVWYFLTEREKVIYKKTMKKRKCYNEMYTFTQLWKDYWISRQRVEKIFKEVEKRIKRIKFIKIKTKNEK